VRLYLEKKKSQKRAGGVDQGEGPEFKPQYHKKKKQKRKKCSFNKYLPNTYHYYHVDNEFQSFLIECRIQ
jgi:hypothetical protein